jgi:hypothetical protein
MNLPINELGQGLTEYAFIMSLVVIVVIVILYFLGVSVFDIYNYFVPILVDTFT